MTCPRMTDREALVAAVMDDQEPRTARDLIDLRHGPVHTIAQRHSVHCTLRALRRKGAATSDDARPMRWRITAQGDRMLVAYPEMADAPRIATPPSAPATPSPPCHCRAPDGEYRCQGDGYCVGR